MPNAFASIALALWIPIVFGLFATLRPPAALSLSLLGANLLLPVAYGFAVPGLGPVGRMQIAALAALAALLWRAPGLLRSLNLGRGLPLLLTAVVVGNVLTALSNGDVSAVGYLVLPSLRFYDGIAQSTRDVLALGLPFVLGLVVFRRTADIETLLRCLAICGVAYSALVVFEARMSPHLHLWVYGYSPRGDMGFLQTTRGGGWRPQVFVGHGLALSMFMAHATIAALGLRRARVPLLRLPTNVVGPYLYAILLVTKSTGAILLGTIAGAALSFLRPRMLLRVAVIVSLLATCYPLLRGADLVPTRALEEYAQVISEDRRGSLAFRFFNEDMLLDRALERVWFGWGTYGRNSVYDPLEGRELSTFDGYWILILGIYGIFGYVARYALLVAPVWLALRRWKQPTSERGRWAIVTLVWILTVQIVDLVPNAMVDSIHFAFAGALAGALRPLPLRARQRAEKTPALRAVQPFPPLNPTKP